MNKKNWNVALNTITLFRVIQNHTKDGHCYEKENSFRALCEVKRASIRMDEL
jgi:hypothetical protein